MSAGPPDSPPRVKWGAWVGLCIFSAVFIGCWLGLREANAIVAGLDRPASTVPAYRVVRIPEGASPREIATTLWDNGLIVNRDLFVRYAQWRGVDDELKYGEYRLSTGMNMREVLDRLTAGNVLSHRFTVREGATVKHVAAELDRLGLAGADAILALAEDPAFLAQFGISAPTAEGYFFPETYHVARGTSAEQLCELMLLEFQAQTRDLAEDMAAAAFTPHDIVKIASIIEKEAQFESDMPLIAAVIYNRLQKNMRLQCDVTIRYPLDNYGKHLTYADLQLDSPYNSYKHAGLPPTPICNPGRAALEAAVHPAKADYLYFVSMNNGAHLFSKTYQEHRAAVRKYQIEHERGNNVPSEAGYERSAPPTEPVVVPEILPGLEHADNGQDLAALQPVADGAS